jgi:hypothetical protein
VLAFDASFTDRRDEGFATLASFAANADSAERAGVLATRTPWPLGGEVEAEVHGGELMTVVGLIDDPTGASLPPDATRSLVGPYVEVAYDDGRTILIDGDNRRALVVSGPTVERAQSAAVAELSRFDDVPVAEAAEDEEGQTVAETVAVADKRSDRKKPGATKGPTDSSNHATAAVPAVPDPVAGSTADAPAELPATKNDLEAPARPQGRAESVLSTPSRRVELRRATVCDPVDPAVDEDCEPAWEVRLIE